MVGYYFWLAMRSLARNSMLTALMIVAIGVGVGASTTTMTLFRAMSGNPLPGKSDQLFVAQIDNLGPAGSQGTVFSGRLPDQLTYTDAMALMRAHQAVRQTAMYGTGFVLTPPDSRLRPFQVTARAAYSSFFPMFSVPFEYGGPWSAAADADRAPVVVISKELNDRIFNGSDSVGKTIRLDNEEYRIAGVIGAWNPVPRVYDLINNPYGRTEQLFLPFTRAIDKQMNNWGANRCGRGAEVAPGWDGSLRSECVWIGFWVELPTAADVSRYRLFLLGYATEQQRVGRFHWKANTELRNLSDWLVYEHVVSDEVRILVIVSFSFLAVCLLNAMGLMLAKNLARETDIGVRRAMGASKRAIFAQYLMETGLIGCAGGLLGLALATLGLMAIRSVYLSGMADLTRFDAADIVMAITLAILATVASGLYPTWRAARAQPALQLKAQ
jgi:putative ABC transport system permease protein